MGVSASLVVNFQKLDKLSPNFRILKNRTTVAEATQVRRSIEKFLNYGVDRTSAKISFSIRIDKYFNAND